MSLGRALPAGGPSRRLVAFGAVAALSTASLAGARGLYLDRARSRLDAATPRPFAWIPPVPAPPVLFVGDSRIAEWRPAAPIDASRLARRGVAGETAVQLARRFGPETLSLRPRLIVLQAGINDLVAGAALGRPLEAMLAASDAIASILAACRAQGIRVVLLTVPPPGRWPMWRRLVGFASVPTTTLALNTRLRAMAAPGIELLDAARLLAGDAPLLPSAYARDTLHWTKPAYALLDRALAPRLADAVQ